MQMPRYGSGVNTLESCRNLFADALHKMRSIRLTLLSCTETKQASSSVGITIAFFFEGSWLKNFGLNAPRHVKMC